MPAANVMVEPPPAERRRSFPAWGSLALPACVLWGTLLGNTAIGAAIGAGLGVGIGMVLFAAAVVVASRHF